MNERQVREPKELFAAFVALGLVFLPSVSLEAAFRFLTQSLPGGNTDNYYSARVITANATGSVTFSVTSGTLPAGITLDPQTGRLTGTTATNGSTPITITANDGAANIQLPVTINISGAGSGGPVIANSSLAQGRVGTVYSQTLTAAAGVGPLVFGAENLPPGLRLIGQTGEISGTPIGAGTFHVNLTIVDQGDGDKKSAKSLTLVVLPLNSNMQFTNVILSGGEVGSVYADTLDVTGINGQGGARYTASGLPPGITLDNKGDLDGTPTAAGTYLVQFTATKGGDLVVMRLPMWIAPTSTSTFCWNDRVLPAAGLNTQYDVQPSIQLDTQNGVTVTYTATGLPPGISQDGASGELSGTPTKLGVYPVTFTATDAGTAEELTYTVDVTVLPPSGGNAGALARNLWVKKQLYRPDKQKWQGIFIYNDDRRTGQSFDPATESMSVSLGSRTVSLGAGQLIGSGTFVYKSPSGQTPVVQVKLKPATQFLKLSTKNDTLTDDIPGIYANVLTLGGTTYKLETFLDSSGKFSPLESYWRTAFIVDKGVVKVKGGGEDSFKLSLLLADPAFQYVQGTSTLRLRLLDGVTALVDKTFTNLVVASQSVDSGTGINVWAMKNLSDASASDTLTKFSYQSAKGKLKLSMNNVDLSALPAGEAQLLVELTVGDAVYTTDVTLFSPRAGTYSTKGS